MFARLYSATLMIISLAGPTVSADEVSDFVRSAFSRVAAALEDEAGRVANSCSAVQGATGSPIVGYHWLGEFTRLIHERPAIFQFYALVPSIIVSRFFEQAGNTDPIAFEFDSADGSTPRQNDLWALSAVAMDVRRSPFGQARALVIVNHGGGGLSIVDLEWEGRSLVDEMGAEYRRFMRAEYEKDPVRSRPITALIQKITSARGFVRCP